MKQFHVKVTDRVTRTYLVDAEDEDQAHDLIGEGGTFKLIEEVDDMDGDIDSVTEVT